MHKENPRKWKYKVEKVKLFQIQNNFTCCYHNIETRLHAKNTLLVALDTLYKNRGDDFKYHDTVRLFNVK